MSRTFRQALPEDAVDITKLYRELMPFADIVLAPQRVAQLREDRNTLLIVGEENGNEVIATALVHLCADTLFGEQPYALVDHFIVASTFQREGVGKSLIDYIEAFCAEQNCSKIILNTPAERTHARDFLTAMGFDPDETLGFIKYRKYFAV